MNSTYKGQKVAGTWQRLVLTAVYHRELWISAWRRRWLPQSSEGHKHTWTGSQPGAATAPSHSPTKGFIKDRRPERTSWFIDPCTLQAEVSHNPILHIFMYGFWPHHCHWARFQTLTTPSLFFILCCKNGSPWWTHPSPYTQGEVVTLLKLYFARLDIPASLTSTQNQDDFYSYPKHLPWSPGVSSLRFSINTSLLPLEAPE